MTKKLIKELYRGNKINFFFLCIATLINTGISIVCSIILERILNAATIESMEELKKQIIICIILFALITIVSVILVIVEPIYRKKAMSQYKNNIYKLILEKSIDDFNQHESSVYLSALTNDVNYIEENYILSVFQIIGQITLFIGTVVVMLLYNPFLTLMGVILSLLPLVVALFVGDRLSVQEKKISDNNAGFMHFLKDNFTGFSVTKVFKAERQMRKIFFNKNDKLEDEKAKKVKINVIIEFIQAIVQVTAQLGIFLIGAYISIKYKTIGPSVILIFVQLMNYIMSPLVTLPSLISKRRACLPLFKKIADILDIKEDTKVKEEVSLDNGISINNLSFAYDEKQILNNVNYKFEKNKSYAIVGTSGSGKTTLLNLLIGRNNDYTGEIIYDDKELKNISIDSLFEITSHVEQNVFVFDDSIINNITMYSEVDDEFLKEVIKKSGLEGLIKEKGYDYKCGENGSNLSGGEKQRISIARGLIKGAKLLLMDEATSSLDNETSVSVMKNIMEIDDITKIIITHKLEEHILKQFDEIIVLKNGSIVEKGKFDDLLENNYIFKSLYETA